MIALYRSLLDLLEVDGTKIEELQSGVSQQQSLKISTIFSCVHRRKKVLFSFPSGKSF